MNTIPSTFNEHQINRTILGGNVNNSNARLNISVIMLNKSASHLQVQTIENLINCGFSSIVWIEPDKNSFNIENVSRRFPEVKFLVPIEEANDGELINACVQEIQTPYFLVLRDSLHIPMGFFSSNLAENLMKEEKFCIVPRLVSVSGEGLSVNVFPEAKKGRFLLTQSQFVQDGIPTLFPYDFIGLYNTKKFIALGGFDYDISSSYWQNADLAVRSWLWGEKITVSTSFMIAYSEEAPVPDTTRNYGYLRFYLKNILPKYREDHSVVKKTSFFNYKRKSSCGFFESLEQFKEASRWVNLNKYRFQLDAESLVKNWGNIK